MTTGLWPKVSFNRQKKLRIEPDLQGKWFIHCTMGGCCIKQMKITKQINFENHKRHLLFVLKNLKVANG